VAAWLARTALAAGGGELAARAARILIDENPGFPALGAAAAHSRGLVGARIVIEQAADGATTKADDAGGPSRGDALTAIARSRGYGIS
jgi:hypothetical protein